MSAGENDIHKLKYIKYDVVGKSFASKTGILLFG